MEKYTFGEELDIELTKNLLSVVNLNKEEQYGILADYLWWFAHTLDMYILEYSIGNKVEIRLLKNKQLRIILDHFGEFMQCLTLANAAFENYKTSRNCKVSTEIVEKYIEKTKKADVVLRISCIADVLNQCYSK